MKRGSGNRGIKCNTKTKIANKGENRKNTKDSNW
jgi:hypothetical protein